MINVIDMCEENFNKLLKNKSEGVKDIELVLVETNKDEFIAGDFLGINETHKVDEDEDTITTDYTGRSIFVRVVSVDKPYYIKQGYIVLVVNFCDVKMTPSDCEPQILSSNAAPSSDRRKPKLDIISFK